MIFVPPDAPTTIFTLFSLSKMIVGHMEESGRLPATHEHRSLVCKCLLVEQHTHSGKLVMMTYSTVVTRPTNDNNTVSSPGWIKLLGEGGIPNPLVMYGELKSSISSLKIIPVDRDMTLEPKLRI